MKECTVANVLHNPLTISKKPLKHEVKVTHKGQAMFGFDDPRLAADLMKVKMYRLEVHVIFVSPQSLNMECFIYY